MKQGRTLSKLKECSTLFFCKKRSMGFIKHWMETNIAPLNSGRTQFFHKKSSKNIRNTVDKKIGWCYVRYIDISTPIK
ncbi:hypothetical protein DWX81_08615 [Roseburia inulinivorans]|nr:hypothetical protein DWX81_08615 [Roseburia inulinivorans]